MKRINRIMKVKNKTKTKNNFIKTFLGMLVFLLLTLGIFWGFENRQMIFAASAMLEKKSIEVDAPVEITFTSPVIRETIEKNINIFPQADYELKWGNENKKLTLIPKGVWNAGSAYDVKINGGRSIFLTKLLFQASFETANVPKLIKTVPEDGATQVEPTLESPLEVFFDKPLNNFIVTVSIVPRVQLAYQLSEDQKSIKFLPKQDLTAGQKYSIEVKIRHKKESEELAVSAGSFSFVIKNPEPEVWDKDPQIRLRQAIEFTPAKITQGRYIDINLKYQTMVIFEQGKPLDAFLVSSGKRGMDTPEGEFQIRNKARRVWSKKYSLFMPYWMALVPSGEFGIHELPEWPGGLKEGQNHLGIPVSHGCVRLGVGPAEKVFNWVEVGTPVVIHK